MNLKGECHEIFNLQFFSWFEPICAPDKQAKVFSNSRIWLWFRLLKNSAVCIPLRSQSPRFASHHGVNNLSSVCFKQKFYKCYFSVMPKDIHTNWYCKSQIVQETFLLPKFFEKMKWKDVASTKTRKTDIFRSVWLCSVHPTVESSSAVCITPRSQGQQISQKTLQCASHRGVRLPGVLPTGESDSAVCIIPRSQNAHCGVKIKICTSIWVPLKGQSGEILFRGEQFYHVRKNL